MGCSPEKRTIDNAKELAPRAQMTETLDDAGEAIFASATMADDRTSGVERGLTALNRVSYPNPSKKKEDLPLSISSKFPKKLDNQHVLASRNRR